MLRIPGLGPKKIRALHEKLAIETLGELEYACMENHLVELPGFGARTQQKILTGIGHLKRYKERHLYSEALIAAEELLGMLRSAPGVLSASLAGSIRRGNETVKDIDLLAATAEPEALSHWFAGLPDVESITGRGDTKVSVVLKSRDQRRSANRLPAGIPLRPAPLHGKQGAQRGHAGPGETAAASR